jgi:hypothetical protein
MIGVVVNDGDAEVARELFKLFETPWEPAVPGKKYQIVLAESDELENIDADVFALYDGNTNRFPSTEKSACSPLMDSQESCTLRDSRSITGHLRTHASSGVLGTTFLMRSGIY